MSRICHQCRQPFDRKRPPVRAVALSAATVAPNIRIRTYGAICARCAGVALPSPRLALAPSPAVRMYLSLAEVAAHMPLPQHIFTPRSALPRVRCADCRFGAPHLRKCPAGQIPRNALYERKCRAFMPKEQRTCQEK